MMQVDDFQTAQRLHYEEQVRRTAELQRRFQELSRGMSFGQRIRNLRSALGWSQRQTAIYLGVCARTVIRHEQTQTLRPWTPLLLALRDLESVYAEEIVAYLEDRRYGS